MEPKHDARTHITASGVAEEKLNAQLADTLRQIGATSSPSLRGQAGRLTAKPSKRPLRIHSPRDLDGGANVGRHGILAYLHPRGARTAAPGGRADQI